MLHLHALLFLDATRLNPISRGSPLELLFVRQSCLLSITSQRRHLNQSRWRNIRIPFVFAWDKAQLKTHFSQIKNKPRFENVSKSHSWVHKGLIHQVHSHREPACCGPSSAGVQSQKQNTKKQTKKNRVWVLNTLFWFHDCVQLGAVYGGRMGEQKLLVTK